MRSRRLLIGALVVALVMPAAAASGRPDPRGPRGQLPPDVIERVGEDGEVVMLLGGPYITGPSTAAPKDIALAFAEEHRKRFGLTPRQVDQLVVKTSYGTEHNGAHHVTLGQQIAGHRVAGTGLTFAIDREGRITSVGGPLARGPATGQRNLAALKAVAAAGRAAGLRLPADLPRLPDSQGKQRFENTFATVQDPNPVTAEVVWYPADAGGKLTLAWETDFEWDGETWLVSYVDAQEGHLLHQENRYVHAGPEGTVFTGQHPEDSDPPEVVPFSGIDGSWVEDRVTDGNNVNAYRDLDNSNSVGYQPETPASGDTGHQHFHYTWTDAWATNVDGADASLDADLDAVITQLFYYTNDMHDWLYDYGFDETSRNFQKDNFSRGGAGGDPVLAEAQDGWDDGCIGPCQNNANFATPPDGASPRMQMYMWAPPGRPYRDGSVDGDVIAHEYGHGVSTRLVGGGNELGYGEHNIHASLGEGWSDVISYLRWGDATVGEYVTGDAATGIRRVAYDTSTHTYSDYNPGAGSGHPNGEVWATMIFDVRDELGLDETTQLVIDGMKATPAKPNFMDARDGIISADNANTGGDNFCLLWRVFADRGLGEGATFDKSSSSAPTDDFDVPDACQPSADAGAPYTTDEGTDIVLDASGSQESSHASGGALVSYEWDLDGDGAFDDATGPTATFDDVGDDAVHDIGLRVTDELGISDEDTTTVTVGNVGPSVALNAVASTSENTAITLIGEVSDPGWLDRLTATVDFDDGAGAQPLTGTLENTRPDATLTFSAEHTFGDDGTFDVEVCATDDDGGGDCATVAVVITNTDPTADIGADTYIAHAGDPLDVTANSTDPGSDDLTASWTWGDGGTDTDPSLVDPPALDTDPSPSIQPRDVDWQATHVYEDACLYTLDLEVVDDDGGSASDDAVVVIAGNAELVRGSGWWMNQYRPNPPNGFSMERLECYLEIAKHMSDVFDEERSPLDARSDAVDVLFVKKNQGTDTELFDEQLLAAWLNFADGSLDLDTMVDTDGDGLTDVTFEAAVTTAEAVRLDAAAPRSELLEQKDILERIVLMDEEA